MSTKKIFCLTGMHRSGTTFLGKVFSNTQDSFVWHEPFNRKYGIKQINWDYPLYEENRMVIDEVFNKIESKDKLSFKRESYKDNILKSVIRKSLGGKNELQWKKIRLITKKNLFLKDPFISNLNGYLTERRNVKSVFIVRHPCAVWYSLKKMGWLFDFSLYGGFISSKKFLNINEQSEINKFCELWNELISNNLEISNSNFKVITHESLCEQPESVVKGLCDFFDLEYSTVMDDYIKSTMYGEKVDKDGNKLHHFVRNSRDLVNLWREKLGAEEISIIEKKCNDLISRVYEK